MALAGKGRVDEVQRFLREQASILGLPGDAIAFLRNECETVARAVRSRQGNELRDAAEKERCDFEYKPPSVRFGCVSLRERSGRWKVCVLDNVVLEEVASDSASDLAVAALRRIREIEMVLKQFDQYLKRLIAAYRALTLGPGGGEGYVSVNLLMAMCSWPDVGRTLGGIETRSTSPLQRHQMGYLLAAAKRRRAEGDDRVPEIALRGATQHDTADPSTHISVPRDDSPRVSSDAAPISALTLAHDRGRVP